jgi:signal transduction histidine kinase
MLLSHVRLAEERRASVELEAVHRFSVFCLHDLKNLAARLSLVAQNAERHGADPAFQQSAIGTVKDTSHKMTALISKLSLKSLNPSPVGMPEQVELSDLIEAIVAPLRGGMVKWHILAETTPPILAVRDEIHQVLLNILLNAKQAVSEQGEITIALSHANGSVMVTVQDNGRGIPDERLESLFLPAQSSRPGGLGIGLYQCKQIVEAHQGTIEIHSVVGRGTHVQLAFPVPSPVSGRLQGVMVGSVASF